MTETSYLYFVFVSENAQKGFENLFGTKLKNALVINNPINTTRIKKFAEINPIQYSNFTCVVVGSLVNRKVFFNENGKLDRKKNYKIYLEDNAIFKTKEEKSLSVDGKVLEAIYRIIPNGDLKISLNAALQDIGIDSINFIKLIIELEETFSLDFDEDILTMRHFERIKDIVDYIERLYKG